MPAGTPNCGHEAMKPRLPWVRDHSMAISTEPPHSPPAPMPWKTRSTVSSTAPQMPMLSNDGTNAIRNVAIPIISRVAISVALRPMRSP